jgi:hypothetical protein
MNVRLPNPLSISIQAAPSHLFFQAVGSSGKNSGCTRQQEFACASHDQPGRIQ